MDETTTATTTLPLHLVTHVLERLDNLEDLGSALSGSDVCRSAFDEHGNAIIRGIIRNMISPESLPYAVLMAESKQGEHMNLDAAKAFMSRYPTALENPKYATTTLRGFSMSTLLDLCETYKVVDSIAYEYIRRVPKLPRHFERIHPSLDRRTAHLPWYSETINPSYIRRAAELFKVQRTIIERALLRYEVFCNICLPQQPGAMTRHVAETFLSAHRPSVNVEMRCMFKYLLSRLHEAYMKVVPLSQLENRSRVRGFPRNHCLYACFLRRGLAFAYDVMSVGMTVEEMDDLLPGNGVPHERDVAVFHTLWCTPCGNM